LGLPLLPSFAVSHFPTDFYHQKTDAELRFLLDNPGYYQPELVEEARRELRRRGALQSPPTPLPTPDTAYQPAPEAAPRTGLPTGPTLLGVAVVLALGLGGFYYVQQKNSPAADAASAAESIPVRKAPPKLTEVAMSVVPAFDVPSIVKAQIKRVPASEQAAAAAANAGQPLRQYRELAKRFWTAETQTEYLLQQARQGRLDAALSGHVETAGEAWQQLNKALVYSYKFGPAMTNHLDIMSRVSRQQQEALSDLLLVANNPQSYENDKTRQRSADVSDLLSGLLPKSPVTGEPYVAIVRRVTL
jgi:hypothetical protein